MDRMSDNKLAWTCPKCGSHNLRWMASVIVSASMDKYHNLSKSALRSKDVTIWGVMWDQRSITCVDCGTLLSEGLRPLDNHPDQDQFRHFCPTCEGRGYIVKNEDEQNGDAEDSR